ncbi:MAG: hypothetical protein M3Y18_04190 [Candidatus Eremiobacteraeota bacterium]|nr:hypothetical protein [Candidatus Eremiobacteraeota bacterium]
MKYFAGIDAGQSITTAVVVDESGRELGRGTSGAADEVAADASSTRLHDALSTALAGAVLGARLDPDTAFARIVAGISGYEGRVYGKVPVLPSADVRLVHDTVIAHAGALGGKPGVVVIAGTGSVAYSRDAAGFGKLVGGWGYLFGDEGSAFWVARKVFEAAARDDKLTGEREAVLQFFRLPSLRAISRAVYANEISRAAFARFAEGVLAAADAGERWAGAHLDAAAEALAQLARLATQDFPGTPCVALVGGMLRSATMRDRVGAAVKRAIPNATIVEPEADAALGAARIACA